MARKREPRKLERRPSYWITYDGATGCWRVRRKGRRGSLATFSARKRALSFAEQMASDHVIAQVVLFREDGSCALDRTILDPEGVDHAQALLESRIAPYRDARFARDAFRKGRDAVHEEVEVDGEPLRLSIFLSEESSFDTLGVRGRIYDEYRGPSIAEVAFRHRE